MWPQRSCAQPRHEKAKAGTRGRLAPPSGVLSNLRFSTCSTRSHAAGGSTPSAVCQVREESGLAWICNSLNGLQPAYVWAHVGSSASSPKQ